ncbi:ParA family protein [Modestobacter roseus]|uniref:Chromosome partitioning protein n=1 Tax=Modestobacter roseus TaxID=1181884 RepID=A0A562IWI6_9ACTN|nr:ParA family protein [Modestobacter roseus]MQA33447.1 AAA family ATPase [Modestobacter roseus]TWH74965.1 chromosome partitioning protein [Modestobacter roseus]
MTDPGERLRTSLAADQAVGAEFDSPIAAEAMRATRVLHAADQDPFPRPGRIRVITVANQKGGVGKTTSTVNLGVALAMYGLRTLVIDLDPQGNTSTALGVEHTVGTPSIYDALVSDATLAEVTHPTTASPNLHCVPATIDLAGAEIELVSVVAREHRLRRSIEGYLDELPPEERPHYVLIDCPPSLGLLTLNALVAGDEVLIPIQCEYYALEGLGQLLSNIDLVRAHLNPGISVSTILLTMYDGRTKLADQVADEVRNHFGELVLTAVIPRNVRVSEAPGYGQSVLTYDPGSRGSTSYVEAARELAARGAQLAPASPPPPPPAQPRTAAQPAVRPAVRPVPPPPPPPPAVAALVLGESVAGPAAGGRHAP